MDETRKNLLNEVTQNKKDKYNQCHIQISWEKLLSLAGGNKYRNPEKNIMERERLKINTDREIIGT